MSGRTAPKLKERRRVGYGAIPLDTPPLTAGSFIYAQDREQIFYSFNDSCLKGKTGYTPAGNIPAV
jgi:hypothetical protein